MTKLNGAFTNCHLTFLFQVAKSFNGITLSQLICFGRQSNGDSMHFAMFALFTNIYCRTQRQRCSPPGSRTVTAYYQIVRKIHIQGAPAKSKQTAFISCIPIPAWSPQQNPQALMGHLCPLCPEPVMPIEGHIYNHWNTLPFLLSCRKHWATVTRIQTCYSIYKDIPSIFMH